jgi:hypothetical protein
MGIATIVELVGERTVDTATATPTERSEGPR